MTVAEKALTTVDTTAGSMAGKWIGIWDADSAAWLDGKKGKSWVDAKDDASAAW